MIFGTINKIYLKEIFYMSDLELKTDTQKFKYRVNGIIIHNGKILTIKMKNNISFVYQVDMLNYVKIVKLQ